MRDRLFTDPARAARPFIFDSAVTAVFDDMAVRSIPCYAELQHATRSLILEYATPDSTIYDVGCSTGTLLKLVAPDLRGRAISLVGIDSSPDMLHQAHIKLGEDAAWVSLIQSDARCAMFSNARVVVMNYTLQFVPLQLRSQLLRSIAQALLPGGALVLSEKTCFNSPETQELYDSLYYAFKRRNGYSEEEIAAKRKALKGVLIPQTLERHQNTLREAGFRLPEIFLQGYQFVSMLVRPQ